MRNFKGIIMSEHTCIQTHNIASFSQSFLLHIPPKPIASAAMAATRHYFYVTN